MQLPDLFVHQMRSMLGPDYPDFCKALLEDPPVSIRYNKQKKIYYSENFVKVKWNDEGVYLNSRPSFILDPAWHAGAYYVQEASSMFLGEAVRQLINVEIPIKALDLCAAPGGKTTLLADCLDAQSLILANETIKSRLGILRENIIRWGRLNIHTVQHDPADFSTLSPAPFDLVLVDAPCSGGGLFRKDKKAIQQWSLAQVQHCALRQRRILRQGVNCLKAGGILIYSTCTYNEQENMGNAGWLSQSADLASIPLGIPKDWGIVEKRENKVFGYQFYPHRVRGEGFFIACFKKANPDLDDKPGRKRYASTKGRSAFQQLSGSKKKILADWIQGMENYKLQENAQGQVFAFPGEHEPFIRQIEEKLPRLGLGLEVGSFKHNTFIPSPALALSIALRQDLPALELDLPNALRFLRREIPAIDLSPKGWVLARHRGLNLGWLKILHKRANNYYPKNWRILKQ